MGCDVHGYIEVKINGVWHPYRHLEIDRDYQFFSKMAFCWRGPDTLSITKGNRGLPEDVTALVKYEHDVVWGSDAHSTNWLSLQELEELRLWFEENRNTNTGRYGQPFGYLFGNYFEIDEDSPEGLEDARALIWFDN
jgi:hypothetical protein